MFGYLVIACFLGVAASAPYGGAIIDTVSIPKYAYNYAVSDPYTGDNKAQSEVRDGGVVRGSYSLAEPDGTIRVVDYAADPLTGFNANVKRIGAAVHPPTVQYKQVVAPVVQLAPISSAYLAPNLGLGLGGLGLGNIAAINGLYGLNNINGLGGLGSWNLGVKSLGWGSSLNGWGR